MYMKTTTLWSNNQINWQQLYEYTCQIIQNIIFSGGNRKLTYIKNELAFVDS